MTRRFAVASIAAATIAAGSFFATPASANNVAWSVSIGAPGVAVTAGTPYWGAPVVRPPYRPVYGPRYWGPRPYYRPYYRPAPVVYPAPVVAYPAPVVGRPVVVYP